MVREASGAAASRLVSWDRRRRRPPFYLAPPPVLGEGLRLVRTLPCWCFRTNRTSEMTVTVLTHPPYTHHTLTHPPTPHSRHTSHTRRTFTRAHVPSVLCILQTRKLRLRERESCAHSHTIPTQIWPFTPIPLPPSLSSPCHLSFSLASKWKGEDKGRDGPPLPTASCPRAGRATCKLHFALHPVLRQAGTAGTF